MSRIYIAAVKSQTGKGEYQVTLTDNQWQCSCKDWTRHVPRKDCKHIFAVKVSVMEPQGSFVKFTKEGLAWLESQQKKNKGRSFNNEEGIKEEDDPVTKRAKLIEFD